MGYGEVFEREGTHNEILAVTRREFFELRMFGVLIRILLRASGHSKQ